MGPRVNQTEARLLEPAAITVSGAIALKNGGTWRWRRLPLKLIGMPGAQVLTHSISQHWSNDHGYYRQNPIHHRSRPCATG